MSSLSECSVLLSTRTSFSICWAFMGIFLSVPVPFVCLCTSAFLGHIFLSVCVSLGVKHIFLCTSVVSLASFSLCLGRFLGIFFSVQVAFLWHLYVCVGRFLGLVFPLPVQFLGHLLQRVWDIS